MRASLPRFASAYRGAPHRLAIVCAAGLGALATGFAVQAAGTLKVNGKVASTDVRVINGRAYAPLQDIAKALGMTLARQGSVYTMEVPGGANQIQGVRQGKLGDELFTGKWRFQVLKVARMAEYKARYYEPGRTVLPKQPGDELIVLDCRVKNGMQEAKQLVLQERAPGNTALADDQGRSHAPVDYDAAQDSNKLQSYASARLNPGSGMDFALVFSVPKGTAAKALVMTLSTYLDDAIGKGVEVRVDLGQ